LDSLFIRVLPGPDKRKPLLCHRRAGKRDGREGNQGEKDDARLMKMTSKKAAQDK
jgi:hypothetical protein